MPIQVYSEIAPFAVCCCTGPARSWSIWSPVPLERFLTTSPI